jgi:hypothetical protein
MAEQKTKLTTDDLRNKLADVASGLKNQDLMYAAKSGCVEDLVTEITNHENTYEIADKFFGDYEGKDEITNAFKEIAEYKKDNYLMRTTLLNTINILCWTKNYDNAKNVVKAMNQEEIRKFAEKYDGDYRDAVLDNLGKVAFRTGNSETVKRILEAFETEEVNELSGVYFGDELKSKIDFLTEEAYKLKCCPRRIKEVLEQYKKK